MNYLIVGLGNIGNEYAYTRHNIGFRVLDVLALEDGGSFTQDRLAYVAEVKYKGRNLYLIKPTTFMNLSGKAVHYWMKSLNIPIENILIITDDIALPFEKMRMRPKGSHGGHNGLRNIEELLQINEYTRLRMGVGGDFAKGKQVDYVLGKFSEDEEAGLYLYIKKAIDAVHSFCFIGAERTMALFNQK